MATLRTYIFALLLICFLAGIAFAQNVEAQKKQIRKEYIEIISDKTLKKVVLENEEFLENMTDGGGTLTGYFKNGEIKRIIAWVGLSNRIQIQEYYFKNDKLIFVYEVFKKYKYDEAKSEFDYSKTKEEYGTRYYFNDKKLIDFKTFGKNREETESAEKILKEVAELLKILKNKETNSDDSSESTFKNQNLKITLINLSEKANEDENHSNTIVRFQKLLNGKYVEVFKDTVFSKVQKVEFEDFNNDKVKDILVQNTSSTRSNWTYNLYLVDTASNSFKKIKGFEEIANPKILPQYNLIESYVLSGKNWLTFYKIENDSIRQYDIQIEDELDNSDKFERDYEKAIQQILAIEKKN